MDKTPGLVSGFARRGRPFVGEDDKRSILEGAGPVRDGILTFEGTAFGIDNQPVGREQFVGHVDGNIHQTTAVAAQVDDKAPGSLVVQLGEGIDEWIEANRDKCNTKEQLLERIREYYDGYRFSPDSDVKVYNPVSIGYFFTSEYRFDNYWDQTGVSSLAVDLAKRVNLVSIVDECVEIRRFAFTSFDIATLWSGRLRTEYVAALLYFAGYLTIGASDEDAISLVFPNREVSSSFSENLLLRYMNEEVDESSLVITLGRTFRRGDAEGFMVRTSGYSNSR